jgi:hypothetical protein
MNILFKHGGRMYDFPEYKPTSGLPPKSQDKPAPGGGKNG